jgi:glycosyltransferase involved in cell wall biosynthesis
MEVSVIVITYNQAPCIQQCVSGILNQSFKDFELIIVDDCSLDGTAQVIAQIQDERIRYIKQERNCGVAESRNTGVNQAKGKYVFFTDADCVPSKYWIEEGLKVLKEIKCAGAEGRTLYATAKTTVLDRIVEKTTGGDYSTCNIAYPKEILDKVGGFDLKFKLAFEDKDIAYRIKKYGEIVFSEDMLVIHQRQLYAIKKLFREAQRAKNAVQFIKKYPAYRSTDIIWRRIAYPKKLLIVFCPFLLIFYHGLRSWQDIQLIPFVYFSAVYLRWIIWKEAIKEVFFLI